MMSIWNCRRVLNFKDLIIGYVIFTALFHVKNYVTNAKYIGPHLTWFSGQEQYNHSFFFNFYCYSITVVCLFSPSLHPTPAEKTSLRHFHPHHRFCPCVLYSSSCNPLFPLSTPHSPLALVRLFLTSMSLVIFCLFFSSIDYVPVKGEIIWYLSLTAWLISLSIMLSSFIHVVAKGISSFFLSAVQNSIV